jgi:hypothetical protein
VLDQRVARRRRLKPSVGQNRRMVNRLKTRAAFACGLVLSACLFDHGVEWRRGPYALHWTDLSDEVHLAYDLGRGTWVTLVMPTVFAVGSDDRYIVAKQHPGGDKAVTNYFIVDIRSVKPPGDIEGSVVGPLTEASYREQAATLGLPDFTTTLERLR